MDDIRFTQEAGRTKVAGIITMQDGVRRDIAVGREDLVFITLGSMTEGSSLGTMDTPPVLNGKDFCGASTLWDRIATKRDDFGRPAVFAGDVDGSKWVSFAMTMHDETLLRLVHERAGNVPGEGGLITFADSPWLASTEIPHQPHFIRQPADISVLRSYGLSLDKIGAFIAKPMSACSGREIMTEILGHLGIIDEAEDMQKTSVCIP